MALVAIAHDPRACARHRGSDAVHGHDAGDELPTPGAPRTCWLRRSQGTQAVPEDAERCGSVPTVADTPRPPYAGTLALRWASASVAGLPWVRKGSSVRVRQRASEKGPQTRPFFVPGGARRTPHSRRGQPGGQPRPSGRRQKGRALHRRGVAAVRLATTSRRVLGEGSTRANSLPSMMFGGSQSQAVATPCIVAPAFGPTEQRPTRAS
jgi:hypothetical protein